MSKINVHVDYHGKDVLQIQLAENETLRTWVLTTKGNGGLLTTGPKQSFIPWHHVTFVEVEN